MRVTDCAAPPAQGTAVKREVFRLSGGGLCLTRLKSNEITLCLCQCVFGGCVRFLKGGGGGGGEGTDSRSCGI